MEVTSRDGWDLSFESCQCANHPSVLQESQMMDRIRQQRFTQDELDVLVREIQARYHRIYGKGLPFAEIRQAWEEVAAAVNNAGFGPTRTASGCQRRFRDLKRRAKMKLVNRASTKPSQRAENGPAGKDTQSCSETGFFYVSFFFTFTSVF